jgi:hypothetical protein
MHEIFSREATSHIWGHALKNGILEKIRREVSVFKTDRLNPILNKKIGKIL